MAAAKRGRGPWRGRAALLAVALGAGSIAPVGAPSALDAEQPAGERAEAADVVELLPLWTEDRRIVDADGRDVILRGANVNSLGEYWQGIPPSSPPSP